MVLPTHNFVIGTLTLGLALIVTEAVVLLHPVAEFVNVKVALPAATGVTKPAFVTVAIPVLLLVHVPPEAGINVMVLPIHNFVSGVLTLGLALTVTNEVAALQPVAVLVYVNVTLPEATVVTKPPFVTVATLVLLLTQVPPVVGVRVIVLPAHRLN
jgi:hypothetical protein